MRSKYNYNTMSDAKKIFNIMKSNSKNEREQAIFFKRRKDTFAYWTNWFINIKTNIVAMEEKNISWVRDILFNKLYSVIGDSYEVEEILENGTFVDDVIMDIQCCADDDFTSEDVEIAFKRVLKKHLLKV